MIICVNCGNQNKEGEAFCARCGVALSVLSVGTKQLGTDDLSAGSEKLGDDHVVLIHIPGVEDPLAVKVEEKIVLGRSGGEASEFALLNLEAHDAENKGVSRRHASLTRDGSRLYLTDLGSTNHTFLNGQRVMENDFLVVRDGDELRLGQLVLKLFYK
jgi:pSer/pThr/pTyr-binding forkhead associated (FHA) protein